MSGWGASYLESVTPKKPLTALSSHEGNRHEYYAQPQDMASYRDKYAEVNIKGRGATTTTRGDKGRGGDGTVQLWVFRVVHLTDVTLASFIKGQGINVLGVQQVSHKEAAYKSFMVTVHEKDAPTLLHKTFWPGLVSCKYWHDQADANRGGVLSRRSSAKSNRRIQQDKDAQRGPQNKGSTQKLDPKTKEDSNRRKPIPYGRGRVQSQVQGQRSAQRGQKNTGRIISSKGRLYSGVRKRDDNNRLRRDTHRNSNKNTQRIGIEGVKRDDRRTSNDHDVRDKGGDRRGKNTNEIRDETGVKKNYNNGNVRDRRDDRREEKKYPNSNGRDRREDAKNLTKGNVRERGIPNRDKKHNEDHSSDDRNKREKERKQIADKDPQKRPIRDDDRRRSNSGKDREMKRHPPQKAANDNVVEVNEKRYTSNGNDKRKSSKPRERYVPDERSNRKAVEPEANSKRQIGYKNRDTRHISSDGRHKKLVNNREVDRKQLGEKDEGNPHPGTGSHHLPEIPRRNPSLTSNPRSTSKGNKRSISARNSDTLPSINSSRDQQREGTPGHSPKHNWVMSLSGLLILSSEEVVFKLLGPDFNGLLSQDVISDDELFLGVKVLAHASRAKASQESMEQLVYKIWQPHIVHLIKTFTVTVERLYPERAERYFWDIAEFLDLYVSGNIHIAKLPNLINTCLMEVLALRYKSYVSEDIVKVFRVMQSRVGRKLAE